QPAPAPGRAVGLGVDGHDLATRRRGAQGRDGEFGGAGEDETHWGRLVVGGWELVAAICGSGLYQLPTCRPYRWDPGAPAPRGSGSWWLVVGSWWRQSAAATTNYQPPTRAQLACFRSFSSFFTARSRLSADR